MAKYDNTGDVKRRRFPFFLTIFIIGIVLFIVGVVLIRSQTPKALASVIPTTKLLTLPL